MTKKVKLYVFVVKHIYRIRSLLMKLMSRAKLIDMESKKKLAMSMESLVI